MGWAREREADEKIYLDADAVENCFGCWVDKYGYGHEPDEMEEFNRILALPAADVIPVSWINKQIEQLKSMDNAFSDLTARQISAMVEKWRAEQNG